MTANNLATVNTTPQPVTFDTPIPLGNNTVQGGNAITHVDGTTDIVLNPNQTYEATYVVGQIADAQGNAGVGLYLDGQGIAGSGTFTQGFPPGSVANLSGSAIFQTTTTSTLTLNSFTNSTVNTTRVNVVKLA
ncbi:hypothetical protein [Paenibacillus jiagnxiensis]|uniref:hypothetical protein n=1 Tax=Paenibacillus jiagnxiensis TaxID=3228926 RepID=UPI0033B253BB